jgi:hypothetical protein
LSGEKSQSLESLRLLITKKYNINQFIFELSSHHIAYTLITGDDYHELFFEKYTQNTLFEEKLINENEKFYDYILLAIKNIYS